MLSLEKEYFLKFISDYLSGEESAPEKQLDWNKISRLAKSHQVNGIIFNQVNEFMSSDVKNKMFLSAASELASYTKRVALYNSICEKFNSEGIPFFSVKGLNVAKYYPLPQNRTMGDCDIIVPTSSLKKADKALKDIGFEYNELPDFESVYTKNSLIFEVHDHLLYDEIGNKKEDRIFGDEAWKLTIPKDDTTEVYLDESFHFIYLLLHLKKHLIHKGAGFRQFMDLYVVAKKSELDWKYIEKQLKELDLLKFARICAALTVKWFGKENEPSPYGFALAEIDGKFYEAATEKIFANGIFGFSDESNKDNTAIQREINKENYSFVQKVSSKIQIVFPKYNDIRFSPKYSFVDKRPWLLPVAWVYRFFVVLFGKSAKNKGNSHIMATDSVKDRKELLDKFGLI